MCEKCALYGFRLFELFYLLHYYSFKIFPRFWLVKTTPITHQNQLLLTKNFVILNHWRQKCSALQIVEPLTSKWRQKCQWRQWFNILQRATLLTSLVQYWSWCVSFYVQTYFRSLCAFLSLILVTPRHPYVIMHDFNTYKCRFVVTHPEFTLLKERKVNLGLVSYIGEILRQICQQKALQHCCLSNTLV